MAFLDKLKHSIKKTNGFRISTMLFIESGIEDTVLTLENISKYGLEIEGNPILREIAEHLGILHGIVIPKMLVLGFTLYTAYKMNQMNYRIKGEYLLYGASFCWLYGAVTHVLLR